MKLSFGPWGETLDEFIAAGISAEQKGFSTLWASELHRTPFVPLTALATNTSEVKLGSGVALAFLRSPLTLKQLGRFNFSIPHLVHFILRNIRI